MCGRRNYVPEEEKTFSVINRFDFLNFAKHISKHTFENAKESVILK